MVRPTPPDSGGVDGLAASNPRIKRLRRLVMQRKARSQERAFVIEGPQIVGEALDAGLRPGLAVEAVYSEPGYEPSLVAQATSAGVEVVTVASGVLDSVLATRNPRPVAAVVSGQPATLDQIGTDGPLVILVGPGDPGNLGTIVRSAEASGAAGVVTVGNAVDPTNPKVLRAAAGAALRLPVVPVGRLDEALAVARASRRVVAAAVTPPAEPYDRVDLRRAALVLGNEAHGLPAAWSAEADVVLTIPLDGPTESLNLAVACSILCFESLRQRRRADVL